MMEATPVCHRQRRLIVVASSSPERLEEIAALARGREAAVVYPTHSVQGCLRVATSVQPDVVLLDSSLPRRLERLLHAHPASAQAEIIRVGGPPPGGVADGLLAAAA